MLPAGGYTVTLRSASNGFVDQSGDLLVGSDGVVGDNYVSTFNVTATTNPILSVPEFARGPDGTNIQVPINTGPGIPITLANAAGVTDVSFDLNYQSALLNISGTQNGPSGTLSLVSNSGGVASFVFHSGTALSGTVTLGQIVAQVPTSAASSYTAATLLHLSNISVNSGAIPAVSNDGVQVIAYLGDASGDGMITGADASDISAVAIGAASGFNNYPLVDPTIIGDVGSYGDVNSTDVAQINGYLSGIRGLPEVPSTPAGHPTLSIPDNLSPNSAGIVSVPVNVNTLPTGLSAANFVLNYDSSLFTVSATDVSKGSVIGSTSGWAVTANVSVPGQVIIGMSSSSSSSIITSTSGGSLVTVNLHLRSGVSLTTSQLDLAADDSGVARITQISDQKYGVYALATPPQDNATSLSPFVYAGSDPDDGLVTQSGVSFPTQLMVSSLTPTSTGFVATFDEPFNPSAINLYDMAGEFGPSDVTLTGPSAPQISFRGSLIIDPTDTTITFVKTSNFTSANFNPSTGVLAAGTYTVTLRSASNGFTDLSGDLLDGGSNYVATFVVSAPPVVVGIPSFARGPSGGSAINLPNTVTFGIPLNLSSGSGVTSGQFTLQYNSALLSITAVTVNTALANATMSLDASSSPGLAVIDFSSPTALTQTGMVRLGGLTATVPNAAVYKSTALLHFSGETLNGGAIAVTGDDAVQVVDYIGDTNGDGTLSAGDAAQLSRVATGIDINAAAGILGGFSGFPLVDPVIIGDLNNDSLVDASDVTLLDSVLSGTPRAQIPNMPATTPVTPTGASVQLSIPTNLTASPGGTVVVPVNINNPDPAGSGGLAGIALAIDFDPTVLTVASNGITPGTLTSNLSVTANVGSGQLGIVINSATPITGTTGGSIVLITFTVNAGAAGGTTAINLAATNVPSTSTVTTRLDSLTAQIPLAPLPTNAANDAGVDGIVTISGSSAASAASHFVVSILSPPWLAHHLTSLSQRRTPTAIPWRAMLAQWGSTAVTPWKPCPPA